MAVHRVEDANWAAHQGEVVTFIDGGIGQVEFSGQVPILLRVGSYSVRTGERQLAEREQFGYYPVILGDLEGGSKDRKVFTDIVRITAELLGGVSALERNPDLRLLMFHGPLVYSVWHYMEHTPFTEADIDLFLSHYAPDPALGRTLKEEFLQEAAFERGQTAGDRDVGDRPVWSAQSVGVFSPPGRRGGAGCVRWGAVQAQSRLCREIR